MLHRNWTFLFGFCDLPTDTSAEQIIDATIKTISTKENNDDKLYPVVNRLKMITSMAIPMPLKKCFPQMAHSFLFGFLIPL
ncbi:hypothetical protein PWEIH_14536 [Listeria weihenstephanensis FSL R9-0317]|nr:hypothetical protein PWEIH_14536 [Listeria weihenstephanensis FSL R9-0317]